MALCQDETKLDVCVTPQLSSSPVTPTLDQPVVPTSTPHLSVNSVISPANTSDSNSDSSPATVTPTLEAETPVPVPVPVKPQEATNTVLPVDVLPDSLHSSIDTSLSDTNSEQKEVPKDVNEASFRQSGNLPVIKTDATTISKPIKQPLPSASLQDKRVCPAAAQIAASLIERYTRVITSATHEILKVHLCFDLF